MNHAQFWGGGGAAPYAIDQSLRFNSADSAYLSRTPASAGNRRTFTLSCWLKRSGLAASTFYTFMSAGTTANTMSFRDGFGVDDALELSANNNIVLRTNALFRDPSAWYHIVYLIDTTQSAAANRAKIYVNGVEQSYAYTSYPAQNADLGWNDAVAHSIGRRQDTSANYFSGYLTEVNFIDGSALDPTSFGELDDNGVWRPIKYAGSYTGNSFYLKFASGDGTDSSGLSNTWTANNFTTSGTGTDVMSDTPTTNWCTLNPLDAAANNGLADGNLKCGTTTAANTTSIRGTQAVSSGKWYFEVQKITTGTINIQCGWAATNLAHTFDTGDTGVYNKAISGTTVMIAADFDNNAIWTGVDGTWDNSATTAEIEAGTTTNATHTSVANYPLAPMFLDQAGSFSGEANFNFGQRAFEYTPPTGFSALNTSNLPAPDIADGSDYFQTVTYSGTGNTRDITVADNTDNAWQPDLVWIKNRDIADHHALFDPVRGVLNYISSNRTNVEAALANSLTSFNSDGFTLGSANLTNYLNQAYVAWNWKKGATPGFDIVTYTGDGTTSANRLIDHSLGVKPDFIITKKRSSGTTDYGWSCWHKDLGGNYGIWLHLTNARNVSMWDGYTNFSSTKFTPPDLNYGNENTQTYVNYLWAEVEGYSKFGSYTGNGSSDGPFVYCGFRPAYVMVKRSDASGYDWEIFDTARATYNVIGPRLWANLPGSETSATRIDFLSNGFKLRDGGGQVNGGTIIFAAFAEHPFGGSGVSPATAR